MAEKIEFDLSVKNNELDKALESGIDKSNVLGGTLKTALAVFGGNLLTKGFSALLSVLNDAADESIKFKRAQLEIETILPANTKLTSDLVKQLENLSKQYGTSATNQAKAYYEIISAGVSDAADGAKLLARANELATGGVTDTGATIDLLTTIYNVYGKEVATAAEASDSLFKTVQLGKTTIQELSQDLGQALPIAKSFGIGLDEVGAILAQLTNSGISTSESVTLLNAVLSAIAKNGDKLGAGFNSTAVQTEGLGVVLERLKERTNGSNDALFELLGRQEAVRAVQSLTSKGLDSYNATLAEYANKAGIAAEASKKIIEGDIGKQFDILGTNISSIARNFIDFFVPATLAATKALNGFLSSEVNSSVAEQGIERTRNQIARLNSEFEKGKIPADDYERSIRSAEAALASFSNQTETASSPLVLISSGLEKEAASIRAQIGSIQNGFDELNLGPIERGLRVDELNLKLAQTAAKIKELNSVSAEQGDFGVAPTTRSEAAIDNELKLQADLMALREQFSTNEKTFEEQQVLADMEATATRNELITQQIYDQKIREADAALAGEEIKNRLIKDSQERAAANQIAFEKNQQAKIRAGQDKVLADSRAFAQGQKQLEETTAAARGNIIGQSFQLAAALAKDGSKTQFAIQKAAALAEIAIADGKARALIPAQTALVPFPGNLAAAATLNAYVTAQTALGASIVAATAIKGFAGGGIIGASDGPDNRLATVRDGEMVLNASQQGNLFNMINSGGAGGGDIVVNIDGREVFRAVKNQIQAGARL